MTMTADPGLIAGALIRARRGGAVVAPTPPLPDPATAYAVQDRVIAAYGGVAGWKGGPVDPAQTRASPILAGGVVRSPASFDGHSFRIIGVEGEIAFVLRQGFGRGSRPADENILRAVASAHVAIEVCDTRIEPWREADPLWKLADCQANRGLVLGDAITGWRDLDLSTQRAAISADGVEIGGRTGPGPTGDPRVRASRPARR
jgi:2-keto-4-pentenoate hydratase